MSDSKEQELYEAFIKARSAMWEAHNLWEEYLNKKMKEEYDTVKPVSNISPTCVECGKPYFSIPRLGIFHICSKV